MDHGSAVISLTLTSFVVTFCDFLDFRNFLVSSRYKDLLSPLRGGAIVGEQGLHESAAMRDMASLLIRIHEFNGKIFSFTVERSPNYAKKYQSRKNNIINNEAAKQKEHRNRKKGTI